MKVEFLSKLHAEIVNDDRAILLAPFVARVTDDSGARDITVPSGFETDFASTPRLPMAYLIAGGIAKLSAVVHDYLYSTRADRKFADSVFLAAMKSEGVPGWRRSLMYAAVRALGGSHYQDREPHQDVPDTPA